MESWRKVVPASGFEGSFRTKRLLTPLAIPSDSFNGSMGRDVSEAARGIEEVGEEGDWGKRWDPGRKERQPLLGVQSSSANQNPMAEGGSVYRKVESLWLGTAPPILGCLQMIILCNTFGSL